MSFLPGLGLAEPEEAPVVLTSEHDLVKGSEWRFEVAFGKHIEVKLLTGTAEINGTELVISHAYTFTGTKLALYTWHGCTFTVSGDAPASEYTAEETPMTEYANAHFALENLRQLSRQNGRAGPRILILGPSNAGKTSLAKILTAYAVRSGRVPLVVNLDPQEGVMSVPGTLTAAAFKTVMDIEEGWASSPMSGPSAIPVKLPLVYYYGLPDPADKEGANYRALISRLALAVAGRLQEDGEVRETGVIIDTPGSLTSTKSGSTAGYEHISHIISEFSVSHIAILGSERLYNDMAKRFDGKTSPSSSSNSTTTAGGGAETIAVIKLPKSGGCVDRDEHFMKALRAAQVKSYFYGTPDLPNGVTLSPRQQQVEFSQLTVYRLRGSDFSSSTSGGSGGEGLAFLPGGLDDDDDTAASGTGYPGFGGAANAHGSSATQIYERMAAPVGAMRNCVLAVMNADPDADELDIRHSSVLGFLYVVDVDDAKARLSLLAPVAGRIPARAIVWAPWPEEVIGMV